MIIDKQGKLFGKISIIDIIVVLAIFVAGYGVYNRFTDAGKKVETQTQGIEYTLVVEDVRMGTVTALERGGKIFQEKTNDYLGEIIKTEYTEAFDDFEMINGEIKNMLVPEKYDVTITVKIDGKVNSSGYYTNNNTSLNVGSKYTFNSKYAETTGKIMSVEEAQ